MRNPILLIALVSFIISPYKGKAQANLQDSLALVNLYDSTHGTLWAHRDNWLSTSPVSTWYGIKLGADGRVRTINLTHNSLDGKIPESIGSLAKLERLIMGENHYNGSLPLTLVLLSNLRVLDLHNSGLHGSLPVGINNIPIPGLFAKLDTLDLSANEFSGGIPTLIGNFTSLTYLDVSRNPLGGTMPASIGNLGKLTLLNFASTQLTGSIPAAFGNLASLKTLILDGNQLTGTIPSQLGNLTKLVSLALSNNVLTGAVPASLGNLANLRTLSITDNQLTGSLPAELGNLHKLWGLYASNNQFAGSIPASFGNLDSLYTLWLYDNKLSGPIPSQLGNLKKLVAIFLNHNSLSGGIPASLGNLTGLTGLYLQDNQLSGAIPPQLAGLTNLRDIQIQNNRFTFNGLENMPASQNPPIYAPQATIPLQHPGDRVAVSAGINMPTATFRLYKNNVLLATKNDDSVFAITDTGYYYITTNHNRWPLLTLYSDTLHITTLPVLLGSFTATRNKNNVVLHWQALQQLHVAGYVPERSTNGLYFTGIGNVQATGSPTVQQQYAFTDENINTLAADKLFYRLKIMDKDGAVSYSKIISLDNDGVNSLAVIYPNPARAAALVQFTAAASGQYAIAVTTTDGKPVKYITVAAVAGVNKVVVDVHALPNTTYLVTVTGRGYKHTAKLVKE